MHVASSCSTRGGWPHRGIRPSWTDAASDTCCHKARESASSFTFPCSTILCCTSVSMHTLHTFVSYIRARGSIQPRPVDGTFLSICVRLAFLHFWLQNVSISTPVCVVPTTRKYALPPPPNVLLRCSVCFPAILRVYRWRREQTCSVPWTGQLLRPVDGT